jgi:DNA repair protein RadC
VRIWDVPPSLLCRQHLLGEHRELHGLWRILTEDRQGYARHPETRRWRGKLAALYQRHESLVKEMAALEQEELRVVLLDTKHRIVRTATVYRGSVNQAQVRVAEVFRDAVRQQATALVAVHNHPSGDPTPSAADVALTVEIVAAGQLLDIELLDHLIIGQGRWLSLKRLGLGFPKA